MISSIHKKLEKQKINFKMHFFYCFDTFCEDILGATYLPQIRVYHQLMTLDQDYMELEHLPYYREQDVYNFLKTRLTGKTWTKSKFHSSHLLE